MKPRRTIARLMTAVLLVAVVAAIGLAAPAMAVVTKSLYVIANINASPTPINAYGIVGNTLVYQATDTVPAYAGGAVGLAIDTNSGFLFVTYEASNVIQLVDAKTMTGAGSTTAPGASNLAGIVVDEGKQKVYAVDRNTSLLYVYSWNSTTKTLTLDAGFPKVLPGTSSLHGIALDEVNDLLYVGDSATTTIRYFNTSDWSAAGSFALTSGQTAMGIAVDPARGFVYTGNAYPSYGSLGLLSRYDLNSNTESTVNIRTLTGGVTSDNVLGIAVDLDTGLVYISTGSQGSGGSDRVIVFDSSLTDVHATADIGNPTGLCIPTGGVSYNPLNLTKVDDVANCVKPGEQITYTISYDNTGNPALTGVVIVDTLPSEVTFVSASGVGNHVAGTVTWSIGDVGAGAQGSVTVTVTVNAGTPAGTIITDTCSIDSDQTGQAFANEDTTVCTNVGEEPPVEVGGDVSPVNRMALLAPWIALAAVIVAGTTIVMRRRLTQS